MLTHVRSHIIGAFLLIKGGTVQEWTRKQAVTPLTLSKKHNNRVRRKKKQNAPKYQGYVSWFNSIQEVRFKVKQTKQTRKQLSRTRPIKLKQLLCKRE